MWLRDIYVSSVYDQVILRTVLFLLSIVHKIPLLRRIIDFYHTITAQLFSCLILSSQKYLC